MVGIVDPVRTVLVPLVRKWNSILVFTPMHVVLDAPS